MGIFNSNAFHNVGNWGIILTGIIGFVETVGKATGCTDTDPSTTATALECSHSVLPPAIAFGMVTGLGIVKSIVNITRDGLGGLFKQQPPVADNIVTIVQPVAKPENSTDKIAVKATVATEKKGG